jgi:peptide/nickel transport system permease protein
VAWFVARRLVQAVPVLVGISIVAWALMELAPGDAAEIYARQFAASERPTREEVERAREELNLDGSILQQYLAWAGRAARGDLGRSFRSGQPVTAELLDHLPATLQLAAAGAVVILAIGLPLGVLAALYQNRWPDTLARLVALIGGAVPSFWLALLLIWLFAVRLDVLPSFGRGGPDHLILPALALGLVGAGAYARLLRATMLDTLSQEFILAAHARGVSRYGVTVRHALRNALIPVVTQFGLTVGALLSGAVVIETIFAWPGIGKFAVDAIGQRDYPALQGFVLFSALVYVAANIVVDLTYRLLDPRIGSRGAP